MCAVRSHQFGQTLYYCRPSTSTLTRTALLLPRGFPSSVTPDYLTYQLWSLPVHITGWMSVSLATSNLLQAVGISAGAATTTAAAAAIKWITKDGIGALGRLLVGGRLSTVFDEDPKRWRMNAEFITTTGLALEIATGLFPASFLVCSLFSGAHVLGSACFPTLLCGFLRCCCVITYSGV